MFGFGDYSTQMPKPPAVANKIMGEWQTKNKTKQIVMPVKPKITKEESAIEYCEREYPQMMDEFKKIQAEMYETFCKKQRNYGPGNISVGTSLQTNEDKKLSLTGLWFRINDKVQRLKQLVVLGQPDEVGESVQDTYQDLSVYGIIAQLVQRGKWAK
jgi:hypothetical protein